MICILNEEIISLQRRYRLELNHNKKLRNKIVCHINIQD